MLKELTIRDFAIIEDITINFKTGMSAILGETGAGKSIIIEAFSLLLGNRANPKMIRSDKNKAMVEAIIEFTNIPMELIDYKDENNEFIFTRIINKEGNNICKINGMNVTINILKNTLAKKVNLHSQHDLFYLLDSKYHLALLDKFSGDALNKAMEKYQLSYKTLKQKQEEYETIINKNKDIDIDYLTFQLEEIENIDIKEGEIEEIETELTRINKFDKLTNNVKDINELFDKEEGINDLIYRVKRNINNISDDPLFSKYLEQIINLSQLALEIHQGIIQDYKSLDFDSHRLEYLKERNYQINKLKCKYGNYKQVIEARDKFKKQIDFYNDKDYFKNKLEKEIEQIKLETYNYAKELSLIRKENAKVIANMIAKELADLYLNGTVFETKFIETDLTNTGIDKVEFMISTNIGEQPKPLSLVVSGGEASRITLALNVVFNKVYDINLAIFDEVDSGVSGKVARSMGKKMKELANNYQVITISHLPQVLSFSNNFYYIGKNVKEGKTASYLKELDKEQQVIEIAKILSGTDTPSQKFIENARELLEV